MTLTSEKLITADELLRMGDIGRCELIYGELIMMSPAGAEHGVIAIRICSAIVQFVEQSGIGVAFASETGFKLASNPDLVRAPDASYVRKERLTGGLPKGFFPGAPDLAVEVVSPDDSRRAVAEKVNTWLAHGSVSVWVAEPSTMSMTIHRTGAPPQRFELSDTLVDERVLPGFGLPLRRVFALL